MFPSSPRPCPLTHDIVWLEEREVNGEKVLVPVLYLAQVGDRLAPSGALIQGQDVALISGGNLNNSGTLRASENLSVTAANIGNSGLMQASDRLQLLATNSIRNAQGGIINGQDVSLIALTGDISNERTISQQSLEGRGFSQLTSVVDKAAGIEAGNDLQLNAKGDIQNIGGSLKTGGDAKLNAGGDVIIASAAEERGSMRQDKRHFWSTTSTTQHGSDVQVGGDLAVAAGQDIAVVASTVKAGGDVLLDAGRDVTIAAAANESSSEYHYKRSGKKIDKENSSVRQQAAVIEAGGDLDVWAEGNLILSASQLRAEGEAYLYAGEQLALLAAQNSDYYLYDMKKKGSWGSKKTQRDEVTTVRNVGSSITTGGDLTLVSEGDQLYQKARLESGNDLILDSGGSITFEAVKDLDQESHEKSSNSLAWTSAKGKGSTDETLYQSQLIAKGDLVIQAVDGLKIDVKEVNQQSVSQTIDAMVKADPELAWLKEMEQRGDVDWRQVKEIHDSFKYSHSGLGAGASMIIAIAVAYFTAGAMSGLVANGATAAGASTAATSAGGAWAAGTGASLSGIGWANAAVTAGLTGMTSNAAISTINNRGNLGAVFKDITTEDALRGYAVAGITAGLTNGLYDGWVGTETGTAGAIQNGGNVIANGGLSTLEGIGRFAGNQLLQNGTSTVLDRALGGDSSFSDALRSSLANTFAAAGFNLVGDLTAPGEWDFKDGSPVKIAMHAVMGGLAAEAAGGDFKTGALAAGVNELLVDSLSKQYGEMDPDQKKSLLVMNSQVIGVLAAAAQGGDENALQTGSWVAGTATQYNRNPHSDEERAISEEAEKGDFEKEKLEKAACYAVKCWAVYPRNSTEYLESYVSDIDIAVLGNELAWIESQQDKGLFVYSVWDGAKDFVSTDGAPLGKYTTQVVGGVSVYSGVSLCAGTIGLGCALGGGSMTIFGAGNITEGTTGFYTHFSGGSAFNPVRTAFNSIPGGYGPVLYSGADLATSLGVGFVKVPLAMGKADGLNRPKSIFGVMVSRMDNNFYIPLSYKPTPYGTAGAIYLLGVGGKGYDLGGKILGGQGHEN